MKKRQQVDDGQLAGAVEAQEEHGKQQVPHPQAVKQHGALDQPVLEKQDCHQQQKRQGDHHQLHGTLLPQQRPGGLIGGGGGAGVRGLRLRIRRPRCGACRYVVGAGDALHCFADRAGHHHCGDSGAADAVDAHVSGTPPGPYPDTVGTFPALELVDEVLQVLVGDANNQDGFLVVEDMDTADQAVLPQPDYGIDGLAGVGRDRCQFFGAERVAEGAARAAHQVGSGLAIQRRDGDRRGEHLLYVAQGQLRGAGGAGQYDLEQQAQQPQDVSMRCVHSVVSRGGAHYAANHGRQCHALPVPAPLICIRPCRLRHLGVTTVHAEKLADITPAGPPGGGPDGSTGSGQRTSASAPQ